MHTAPGLESREADTIEQPAPTVWPMVAALGVTLMFGGLVTHVIVSVVGLLLSLIAAVGWWKEVLPEARVEYVHLPPPGERAGPVVPVPATVEHLTIGEAGHRVRVPVEVQPYSAGWFRHPNCSFVEHHHRADMGMKFFGTRYQRG
jgi:hypothetical protein